VQEVFLRVARRPPSLRDPAALPGWMCTTARNAALDRLRRRRREPRPAPDAGANLVARESGANDAELRERVLVLLARLPDAYREALVLRLVEGLDGPAIAALTGMTLGSVRVHLHRGLELLRPLLREEGW
jgi:RNA polymerase sigma-70 factor, ECF subfamily